MAFANSTGYMLDLNDDLHDDWSQFTTREIVDMAKRKVKGSFDIIVSHDKNGEYGHCQHKRVHVIAKGLAKTLEIPFHGFKARV